MSFLYGIPTTLVLAVALILGVGVACAGQIVVRKSFPETDFIRHNEVAGFIIAVVGVFYGVLLGFATIVSWEEYDASSDRVQQEAAAASNVWMLAPAFPSMTVRLQRDVQAYARQVVDDEWPAMHRGESSPSVDRTLDDLKDAIVRFSPAGERESQAYASEVQSLQQLDTLRRYRLHDNETNFNWLLWVTLFIGAVTTVGFTYLFGMHNPHVLLVMTSAVTIVIVTLVVVIFEFDLPFRSDVGIRPEPFVRLTETLHTSRPQ
jgi:hypothetical protein